MCLGASVKQLQGALVGLQHTQAFGSLANAFRMLGEVTAKIGNAFTAPLLEQAAQRAVILQPQGHRRERKHAGQIGIGSHGFLLHGMV